MGSDRPCSAKKRFLTGPAARRALERTRNLGTRYDHKPIRAYACGYCGGWHLTASPA